MTMAEIKTGFVPNADKIYTVQELAAKFHCSRQTMKKWLADNEIYMARVGNNYFVQGQIVYDFFLSKNCY